MPEPARMHDALARFLEGELERLGRPFLRVSFREVLIALNGVPHPQADAACRQFARQLDWPVGLSDAATLEICLRLCSSAWYCHRHGSTRMDDEETLEDFLESLLVEWWHDVGREKWLAVGLLGLPDE